MIRLSRFVCCLIAGLLPAIEASARTPGAAAPMPCHDYQRIVETLDKRYGESPVSAGLQTNGNVLQVFSSPESGSWTILSVAPSGIGCIVAAGKSWHEQKPRATDPST